VEKAWFGSVVVHIRGNCDYLIMNKNGRIGYSLKDMKLDDQWDLDGANNE